MLAVSTNSCGNNGPWLLTGNSRLVGHGELVEEANVVATEEEGCRIVGRRL